MNDIKKKLEALKAEFLGKLEELEKEAGRTEAVEAGAWRRILCS